MGDAFITRRGGAGGGMTIKNSKKVEVRTYPNDIEANMFTSKVFGFPYDLLKEEQAAGISSTINQATPFYKYIIPGETEEEALLVSLTLDRSSPVNSSSATQVTCYIRIDKRVNGGDWEFQSLEPVSNKGYFTNTQSIKFLPIEGSKDLFTIISFGGSSTTPGSSNIAMFVDVVKIVSPDITTRAGDADTGDTYTEWHAVHMGKHVIASLKDQWGVGPSVDKYDVHTFKDLTGKYNVVVVYNLLDSNGKVYVRVSCISIDPITHEMTSSARRFSSDTNSVNFLRDFYTYLDKEDIIREDAANFYGKRLVIAEYKNYIGGEFTKIAISYMDIGHVDSGKVVTQEMYPSKSITHGMLKLNQGRGSLLAKRKGSNSYFFAYPNPNHYIVVPFSLPDYSSGTATLGTTVQTTAIDQYGSQYFTSQPLYDVLGDEIGCVAIFELSSGIAFTALAVKEDGSTKYFTKAVYPYTSIPLSEMDGLNISYYDTDYKYRRSGALPHYRDSEGDYYGYLTTVNLTSKLASTVIVGAPLIFSMKLAPIDLETDNDILPKNEPRIKPLMTSKPPTPSGYSSAHFISKGVVTLNGVKEKNSAIASFGALNASTVEGVYEGLPNLSKLGQLYVKEAESEVLPFGVSITPITKDTGSALVVK